MSNRISHANREAMWEKPEGLDVGSPHRRGRGKAELALANAEDVIRPLPIITSFLPF